MAFTRIVAHPTACILKTCSSNSKIISLDSSDNAYMQNRLWSYVFNTYVLIL